MLPVLLQRVPESRGRVKFRGLNEYSQKNLTLYNLILYGLFCAKGVYLRLSPMYNAKNKRENCQKEEILDRKRAQSWNASNYKNILDRMTDKTTRQETYRDRGDNQFIFVNTFVRNICVQL
jgi:hypothetical protein